MLIIYMCTYDTADQIKMRDKIVTRLLIAISGYLIINSDLDK